MFRSVILASLLVLEVGCSARLPVRKAIAPDPTICFPCFWEHQPPELRRELLEVYGERRYEDPLAEAERRLVLGRVAVDPDSVCESYRIFRDAEETDPGRRLLAAESTAFLGTECGGDATAEFREAARIAEQNRNAFKAGVYRNLASGTFLPRFGSQAILGFVPAPDDAKAFVLGVSSICVGDGSVVTVQSERTVRDWLSYQLDDDLSSRPLTPDRLVGWHEGARLHDLLSAVALEAFAVRGTLLVRHEDRWLAPDETGVFRFEVLQDKVQYPSTRVYGDVALVVDTHGVSALVHEASRSGAEIVLACGDHPEKMRAAYRLASRGISVWFPCDRFVADVLGHDAPGVLLGSAPIRRTDGGAVIGNAPVVFRTDERIVVQDSDARGAAQYYDAAGRYFRRLSRFARLRLDYRMVDGPGQADRIVEGARATGAEAIALRVATVEDSLPVRAWLEESREHRAVLFHSAPYPEGIALFRDFRGQTTFGDPRPIWLGHTDEFPSRGGGGHDRQDPCVSDGPPGPTPSPFDGQPSK
jgi:hypothetical protein